MEDLDDDGETEPDDNSDLLDGLSDDDPESADEEPSEDDEDEDEPLPDDEGDEDELAEPVDEAESKPSLPKPDKKVFFNIPLMESLGPNRMPPETVGDLMAILRRSDPTDKLLIRSTVGKTAKTVVDVDRKVMVGGQSVTYIEIV